MVLGRVLPRGLTEPHGLGGRTGSSGASGCERKPDGKYRAMSVSAAFRRHGPAVEFDKVSNDLQPQAQSALRARDRGIFLAEAVEDIR